MENTTTTGPISPAIYVPPAARLSIMRGLLLELCTLLDRALEPAKRFKRDPGTTEDDVKLAVVLHAFNALDSARAVQNLSGTDYAGTVSPHYRTVFEALVKIRWMRKHPKRGRMFLESDPFERYALATPRVKKSKQWVAIVAECKKAVAANPILLELPDATTGKGKNLRPNFDAIAQGMRMPSMTKMTKALGMNVEDYLIDHAVPSLTPHSSVLLVSQYPKKMNADGSVTISSAMDVNMLLGYVSLSATRSGEILDQLMVLYPDGKIMFDSGDVHGRLTEAVKSFRDSWVRSEK